MCSKEFSRRSIKHIADLLEDTQHTLLDIASDEEGCKSVRCHVVEHLQPVTSRLIDILEGLAMLLEDPVERDDVAIKLAATMRETLKSADTLLKRREVEVKDEHKEEMDDFLEFMLGGEDTIQN